MKFRKIGIYIKEHLIRLSIDSLNIILFVSNLLLDAGNWWFLYPLCDWGIAVLIQATTLFTSIRPNATLEKKYIK